jgi:hypothetical protein
MAEVTLTDHPYMRIGTPAHTGPYSRLRGNYLQWLEQGAAAWPLIVMGRGSVRQAARMLGLSPTTAWRRAWWFHDYVVLNQWAGLEPGPVPHQRGTRAVPHGRPACLPRDSEDVLRDIRAAGYTFGDIIGSHRTVPKCVRDLAAARLAEFRDVLGAVDDDTRQRLLDRYPPRARTELLDSAGGEQTRG